MLQSETYVLWDTLFHDEGTSEPATGTWVNTGFNASFSDNGTLLTATQTFCTYFANIGSTSAIYDFASPFIVEFDLINFTTGDFQIFDQTNNCTRTFAELGCTSNNHIKIVNHGTIVKYYVDGVEKTSKQFNYAMGICRMGFRNTSSSQETIKFKNFVIYPV